MNQKVILTILIVVLLAAGGAIFYAIIEQEQVMQESTKKTPTDGGSSKISRIDEVETVAEVEVPGRETYTEGSLKSLRCPLDQSGSDALLITNPASSFALSSKTILREAGLSEEYLNENFVFLCGIEYSFDNRRVAWKYTIEEYSGVLEGIVNPPSNVAPNFSTAVGELHDIQYVLSRDVAEEKIKQCLGVEPLNIEIRLVGGPRPYPKGVTQPEVSENNENGGLFMLGKAPTKKDLLDPYVSYLKTAFLNLETEKCTILEETIVSEYIDF